MSDNAKLSIGVLLFFVADLALIAGMYVHGKMHLINTLKAAIAYYQ